MGEVIHIQVKQGDGTNTKLTQYLCPEKPRASILILHGMAEHKKRYKHFAAYLTTAGYDVFIYDQRGHGKELRLYELGFIAPNNGYELLIQDAITVSKYIDQHNRSNRLYLLGHSMGSLVARNVIQCYDQYSGVILSGTMFPSKLMVYPAYILASTLRLLKGPKKLTPFINNLMFGNKYYTAHSRRTVFDWLTRSNPIVGAYIHDPYCGFVCSTSFYKDLLTLVLNSTNINLIPKTNKNLPLYIISGEKDAVSCYAKEIKTYLSVLKELGFNQVDSKIYPNCRHEILNELNRDEVYSDINAWMTKYM